jgi:hypothetical protein
MRHTLAYLKYVVLHKWFVFLACRRLRVSLWQALVHDLSKFSPAEFVAYRRYFFDRKDERLKGGLDPAEVKADFLRAWNHHQKANKHHPEYWVLPGDKENGPRPLPMPSKYVREMVADWMGAGRAKTGSWDMNDWVTQNLPKMWLHKDTLYRLACTLSRVGYYPSVDVALARWREEAE